MWRRGATSFIWIKSLSSREIALALLRVSSNTLLGIFALEAQLLQLALDSQRLGQCHLGTRLHRALNASNRLGSAVGRAEAACIFHHSLPVTLRLIDIINQPQLVRLLKTHQLALGHQLDSLILGQRASHALCPTRTWQYPQRNLRQTHFTRVTPRNTDITGQRNLQPTADRVTIHSSNHQFRRLLQPYQRLIGMKAEIVLKTRRNSIQHTDISPRAKKLFTLPAYHHHMHIIIKARP